MRSGSLGRQDRMRGMLGGGGICHNWVLAAPGERGVYPTTIEICCMTVTTAVVACEVVRCYIGYSVPLGHSGVSRPHPLPALPGAAADPVCLV